MEVMEAAPTFVYSKVPKSKTTLACQILWLAKLTFLWVFFFVQTVKPTSHRDSQGPQTFIHLGGNEEFLACIQISHFSML